MARGTTTTGTIRRVAGAGSDFANHCMELLAPLGPVLARRMFGGFGLYVDDLNAEFIDQATVVLIALGLLIAVVLTVGTLIARGISMPLATITQRMRALAGGDKTIDVPYAAKQDEIGDLARSFRELIEEPLRAALGGSVEELCTVSRDREGGALTGFVLFGFVPGAEGAGRIRAVGVAPLARRRGAETVQSWEAPTLLKR